MEDCRAEEESAERKGRGGGEEDAKYDQSADRCRDSQRVADFADYELPSRAPKTGPTSFEDVLERDLRQEFEAQ